MFKLVSKFNPAGDQPKAITALTKGLNDGKKFQVLLGATGTGKTFTIANVIANTQKKTLVMAHNKTLAAQLYSELKELFPENRVEYFVSYFDFYQPEAYVPRTDTFIEKSAMVNQDIEMLRLSTLNSLTTRDDVIVVASVACIYAAANPAEFEKYRMIFSHGQKVSIKEIQDKLVKLNYKRNPIDLSPGNFRLKGDVLEVAPGWTGEYTIRFSFDNDVIESIATIDALTGEVTDQPKVISIYPADEYVMDSERITESLRRITEEMKQAVVDFKAEGKLLEAQRIEERTTRDVESLREFGMCPGIENYTRHLELRNEGDTPFTLFDYFGKDWLLVMDESHMSVPQIRGMYNTDRSRKETLVRFGFRLKSALDNRPLNFDEYQSKIAQVLFVSATPNEWEMEKAGGVVVEQIVRPTGLLDPVVEVRPSSGQIDDLLFELKKNIATGGKTFVTTLTIRMAEELSEYTKSRGIKSAYLHNELKTLERSKILNDLRRGKFDVVIGINLLREGLDIPEVSLVAILDADKEGFLRNTKSLIQTIGRAARNVNGRVVMYADKMTESIKAAISETDRRRAIQDAYNKKHNITPQTIVKDIRVDIRGKDGQSEVEAYISKRGKKSSRQKAQIVARLRREMLEAAKNQEYERAAAIRDQMLELEAAD